MKRWMRFGILLVPLVTSGCWDRIEVNDIGLVMGTGLDLAEDGNIKATIQIAVPSPTMQASGGASKEADRFFLISAVGKNGLSLDEQLQKKMSRTLFFSHRSIILIGEALARKGIDDILDTFSRNPRNRLKTYVLVTRGISTEDLLQVRYPYELVPSEGIREMQILKGEGPSVTLKDFLIESAGEGISPAVGVLEPAQFYSSGQKNENKLFRQNGTAVFKDSKMIGFLDDTETHAFLWFKNNKATDTIVADLPEGMGSVGYFITKGKLNIEPEVNEDDNIKFHVVVKAEGNLFENNSPLDVTKSNNLELIKKVLEKQVEQDIKTFLHTIQTRHKADIAGFGQQLQRKYPKKWRAVQKQWDRYFSDADISVTADITIKNTGTIGPPLQLKEKEIVK